MKQNNTQAIEEALSAGGAPDTGGGMTPSERRATAALATIFALRMLGLFMILPVLSLFAEDYRGYTAALAGLAIGAYGLTQAVLQIPFGMLSDRVGRRPVIVAGLLLFAAGSVVAAVSDTMVGLIAGRALQGAGAIAAAVMAMVADLTREEHRTKAMAMVGASIGLSFAVALVAGPVVGSWAGLEGLFWITAGLALAGIGVLYRFVPSHVSATFHRDTQPVPAQFARVLGDGQLLRLDAGILLLHMILTAAFVALPLVLRDGAGLDTGRHWIVYLSVLVASVALMVPLVIVAEKHRRMKTVFSGAVLGLGFALGGLALFNDALVPVVALLVLFFTAFNVLEATLPSLISRLAPAQSKGTALGVYSTSQFLGAFVGGAAGGWLYGQAGAAAVFGFCAVLTVPWFLLAVTMRRPRHLSNHMVNLGTISAEEVPRVTAELSAIPGVAEAVVIVEDGIAYLKVDRSRLDPRALEAFSAASA